MPKRIPRWGWQLLQRIWRNRLIIWHMVVVLLLTFALWSVLNVAKTNRKNSREARFIFCQELNKLKIIDKDTLQKDIDDLHNQVSAGLKFLRQHPNGTADFSRELIVDNIDATKDRIDRKKATRKTLIIRDCVAFSKDPIGRANEKR